ncbi:MAG: serine hydrolase domain-containing protein [bacterium]
MQKLKIFISLFVLFCLLFYFADKLLQKKAVSDLIQPEMVHTPSELTKDERSLARSSEFFFKSTLQRSRFNGAILVAKGNRIVFEEYSGLKEVTKGEPIDSATAFHLASVSKTITAMAVMKLFQDSLLHLDDPVYTHLTNFPYPDITIRHLLSHRSGLPNYVHFIEAMGWDTKKPLTNHDLLDLIVTHQKQLKTGKAGRYFDYCNTNYALLALVIEKVSKLTYANYLDSIFFKPIMMEHTFVFSMDKANNVLPSFKFNNQKEPFMFLDAIYGDKNIYSTPRDILKWENAINSGKIFTDATLAEAYRGYSYEKPGIKNYGLGWRLYEMPSGKKIIYHNGWWHGNNTVFSRLPSDSTTIIVLGNKYNRSIYQAKKIASIYTGYGLNDVQDE